MWLRKGEQVVLVPETMPETIKRCLGDGWVEIPDPRPAPAMVEVAEAPVVAEAVVVASAVLVAADDSQSAAPPVPRPHAASQTPRSSTRTKGRR